MGELRRHWRSVGRVGQVHTLTQLAAAVALTFTLDHWAHLAIGLFNVIGLPASGLVFLVWILRVLAHS